MAGKSNHEALVRGQRARKDRTRVRVLAALRTMEGEIAEHGLYPQNNCKINLLEVLRRAGVGTTTLRNPHHHEVRDIAQDWLAQLTGRGASTTKPATRAAAHEKIAWYGEQSKLLSAEALTWRLQKESLMPENQKLQQQIVSFSPEHGKVIGINGMSGKRD
jgi:hypothetical protein